ncbi:unnamed protein product [Rhizoctonia solani]|uniref:AAA ATPase AAA+ lid domain-containing protein n=1 Tax=Rhizoctonia solani TaxID=456999 RepID=A0A8H3AXT1_9AGAM|nr:unnamed protein product [Rhizoctonia solani]
MDGMLSSDVIVIGATNRPFDLDDAVIRRLPCRILIDLPDTYAREAIMRILLKDEHLDQDVSFASLASLTPHFSGSDLKHVCVTAALESAKELANISWAQHKGKKSTSIVSGLGVPSPAASDSGNSTPTGVDLAEGPIKLPSISTDDSTRSHSESQTRTLAKRHFTQALEQVRASTSETQASLVELRRWNDQFGSGKQSGANRGSGAPGPNPSRFNRPWMSGSGAPKTFATGSYIPRGNGMGPGISGTNTMGTSDSEANSSGLSFDLPVEGSYLRSLGVRL